MIAFLAICFSINSNAQLLINPAAEGGFENGPSFADNGWTVVNAATNKWITSAVPGWFTGTNGAHVTNNTTTNAWEYSNNSTSRSHFYRDVVFPTGITSATLTFDWRANGNDTNYDNLLVYVANTNVTPNTSGPVDTNTNNAGWANYTNGTTGYFLLQRNGTAVPTTTTAVTYNFTAAQLTYLGGNTRRLIFVWKNDGTGGSNPPAALDNISLSVVAPTCLSPTTVTGNQSSATSANLSWTAPTTAPSTGYQWEVRTTGAGGSGATGLVDSGSTAAGVLTASTTLLVANTSYKLYVRSNCGAGDFSTWGASSTFTTPLSCFSPTAVTGTSTASTAANLSWTAPTTAPSTGYQWEVRTTGAGGSGATGLVDSGSIATGVLTASTTLLVANTSYKLYVRSNCGAGDFSTWGASSTFTTPLSCFSPTAVTVTLTTTTAANLSWTAPSTVPSTGYQWEVRTTGAGGSGATGLVDSGSTAAGVLTASTTLLVANTSCKLYVRSNCGAGDFSTWSESASFFTGYCLPPVLATSATYINNFSTTGAVSNVSNLTSGFTTGGYQDNYATSAITSYAGAVFNTNVSIVGGTAGVAFWIDWNNNFVFETSERVYNSAGYLDTGSYTSIITVPAGTLNGEYRLRIKTDFNATNPVSCSNGGTRAETEDYKIIVAAQPTDAPDYFGLQSPVSASTQPGVATMVYGQVYEAGLTDIEPGLSGQATGIQAWIGISPIGQNTNPNTWTTWTPATFNASYVGNNDEYQLAIGANLLPGTYYYVTRYRLNSGPYVYGGINTAGVGNAWDGTAFNSGVLTINPVVNDECSGAIVLTVGAQIITSNLHATKSADTAPTCETLGFSASGKDVWYSVVVPANVSRLDIETNNNGNVFTDTGMEVYRGTCGALIYIGCDADGSADESFSLLNLTGLTPGETLYVRVWGYNGTSGSFKIKTSVPACGTETKWDGTAWTNNAPVAGIRAVIEGNYNGPGFTACAMDVIGTSQVVFASGNNLTLNGLLNVASTATMTLESNANLVQTVNGTNTGNVTVKRESAQLVRLDHTLWSSPVTAQKLFAFSPNTLTNRFYTYATVTDTYVNTGLSATTNFAIGKGYRVRAPNNHPETPTTWMGSFTGVPNNGNKTFTLVTTGTGFNLVGNPYPSVIDATAFVAENTTKITGTLYFYAHTLTMSTAGTFPTGTNYALWNATGQTAATLGTSGVPALVPNGKIQVGQGFLVKSTASGDVTFRNTMREASNGNQFFRTVSQVQSTSDVEKHRLWLNLTNPEGTAFNQVLVGYISGATQEVDNLYDGLSFGNEGSALSSRLAGQDFTIQGRALPFNQADIVPLGLKAMTSGNYTISLSDKDGVFAGDQNVYLKDNENGSVNNIKIAPYTFTSEAGTFNNRFEVVYQANLSTPESAFTSNSVVAYIKNAQLNIQTKGNDMKAISVFDVRGRLIFQQSGINAADFTAQGLSAQNQVLLVQVTSQNDEVATVKVIF